MKYEIWTDNGVSSVFESNSSSFNDVLDEYCVDAGYVDHADAMQQMGLTQSPFNIRDAAIEETPDEQHAITTIVNPYDGLTVKVFPVERGFMARMVDDDSGNIVGARIFPQEADALAYARYLSGVTA